MRYLLLFIWTCSFALSGFSQSPPTVTLVFVSSDNSPKNYEAVIDDVSYFSEGSSDNQQNSTGSRNTIWLNNFQPGQHSIKVYSIRNGSNKERAGNSPIYSSSFNVKYGFETNIAVKSNGQVQFSERLSDNDNHSVSVAEKNYNANSSGKNISSTDNKTSGHENDDFDKEYKDEQFTPASTGENDSNVSDNGNSNEHERHSVKRVDTAIVYNDAKNDNASNTRKNSKGKSHSEIRNSKSSARFDNQHKDSNGKSPMNEDQFHEFYESVRNQWLPGQKMKTLNNEFLNAEDNFSTAQAKQLIKLLTEEGNRLKLAKAVYPCITDPENFDDLDELLRYKTSRAELDNFVSEGGKE